MTEDGYSPVAVSSPAAGDTAGDADGWEGGRLKKLAWMALPCLSVLLYLGDLTTTLCYAANLFLRADVRDAFILGLDLRTWAWLIIMVRVTSGVVINVIVTLSRHKIGLLDKRNKAMELLKCCVPEFHALSALYRHMEMALSEPVSVSVLELAAFTRLLQTVLEAVPQTLLQTYFLFTDQTRKDSNFARDLPATSVSFSLLNATFGYTFFLVYMYYDTEYECPRLRQGLLLALASFLILGGRAFSVSLMAWAYMPWLACLCLLIIVLVIFSWWTARVQQRRGHPCYNLPARTAITLFQTFTAATDLKLMLTLAVIYTGLSVTYVIQLHQTATHWALFCVPIFAQVVGTFLAWVCRRLYERAYETLTRSVLPDERASTRTEQAEDDGVP
ncbi:uncharacterized protein [Panulirus ornatus]|uniref:uncharacterized protein n=1 Tax=Panulirus ornatus TaxID=150431 RepID=UPI003A8BDAE0